MRRFKTRLALCGGVAAIVATPACAQEAQTDAADTIGIADIVVTAQRRAEKAQATPLAITAIGGPDLQAKGVFETADLSAVVPNLQIISPYGRAQPNISLRGISVANEYNANQASPIWSKNLFNTGYHVYGLDLRAAFAYDYLALGSPRTFGATVGVKF